MSGHWISIHHESMARHYLEGESLDCHLVSPTVLMVESASNPGFYYRVKLDGDFVSCTCATSEGLNCKHRAALVGSFFHSIRFQWEKAEIEEFYQFLHKIRTGAPLTRSEKVRLSKNKKLVRETILREERIAA